MNFLVPLVTAAILVCCGEAQAEEYSPADDPDAVYISETARGHEHYVLIDTVNALQNLRMFWAVNDMAKDAETEAAYSMAFVHIDCQQKTFGILKLLTYDKERNVLNSREFDSSLSPIVPNSLADGLQEFVCDDVFVDVLRKAKQ